LVCHSNGSHNRIFACCQALYGQRVNANRFTLYTSYLGYACYKPVANGGSLRFWYCRTICLGFDRIRYSYERLDLGTTVEYSSRSYGCFSRDFHTHQNSKSQGKRCAKTCKVGQSKQVPFQLCFLYGDYFCPCILANGQHHSSYADSLHGDSANNTCPRRDKRNYHLLGERSRDG